MSLKKFLSYYNYYIILNKTVIKNKAFHFLFSMVDNIILILKILDIYKAKYNISNETIIKYLKPVKFFTDNLEVYKKIPIISYLFIGYLISISFLFIRNKIKVGKIDMILMNFFEFFLVRFFFIFYNEFLFGLKPLYFLLFFVITIPFFYFILIDLRFFHLTGFMLNIVNFPFDDFTSLCDIQKMIVKIFVSISSISTNVNMCKVMFYIQFLLLFFFLLYDTNIIFNKSYFLMNNELLTKTRFSNLLSLVIIQIFMFFTKPEEIFENFFLIILVCIFIFVFILFFLFYDPYNYIIIEEAENKENLYYYFFLIDRDKKIAFFLEDKIKHHIFKCSYCSLCKKYNELMKLNNYYENEDSKNKINDLFNILYDGKDKSMMLFNNIVNSIKKIGINCLYNNSYYIINLIYIYYYSAGKGEITFPLNLLLIFNLIQENNQLIIGRHNLSIRQITYVNDFLNLYKIILKQIKEIISKTNIKKYFDKFFSLSKSLNYLHNSKFRDYLFFTKDEGIVNFSYLISICSLLYEEIFNNTLSSYAIPIRENTQLYEDILKQFYKQNNSITLTFNLKTIECNILYAAKELFFYSNSNFYDFFPNQIKEVLIRNFHDVILNSNKNNVYKKFNKKSKRNARRCIEHSLLIKTKEDNLNFYKILKLKLFLLINDYINENILLSGTFNLNNSIIVTIHSKGIKEIIFGYGNRAIMDVVLRNKFNFIKFKESDFMSNKLIQKSFTVSANCNDFIIYNINEITIRNKNLRNKELYKFSTEKDNFMINDDKNADITILDENKEDVENNSENNNENSNNNKSSANIKKINNILQENESQSSSTTKFTGNSFWNLNKAAPRDKQNNFYSKSFLNLQILLGGLLLSILIIMIVLIFQLKTLQTTISQYSDNYFELRNFVRTFQQFSYSFMALVCVVKDDNGTCEEYLSSLDTKEFNQTLFISEQNEILAESCSESISKIIINSETIKDQLLNEIFNTNVSYSLMNIKKFNDAYDINLTKIDISFREALLLLSNNMRIIVSQKNKYKMNRESIYLIYSLDNPFVNIKNKSNDFSEYQISAYTYLVNYKLFVQKFSSLSKRLNDLIIIQNKKLINIVKILHNIILLVMIFQIIAIIVYLFTFKKILAQIINSIIIKFDIIFDVDNDFKKLFTKKINQLDEIVNIYPKNPIRIMKEINKNYFKYRSSLKAIKKNDQKIIKKNITEEEDEKLLYKDTQKYITWVDIYRNCYGKFYRIITGVILLIDLAVYGVIMGIWLDYKSKSETTLELIYYSWNFERNTLRIVNFYNIMIFNNQTMEDITRDYFSSDDFNCIENINHILYTLYKLKQKSKKFFIYKSYDDFSDYNCVSLYNYINSIGSTSFSQTLIAMKNKHGIEPSQLLNNFYNECEKTHSFIGNSVSPAFQGLYQKIVDSILLFNNRTYEAIISKLFDSSLPKLSSIFLNVQRYIIYIFGSVTYTDATQTINHILEQYIIITLILYIFAECINAIFFIFIYIYKINNECKNIFELKRVFEVTSPLES